MLTSATIVALLAAVLCHGVLRAALEARGLPRWRVRDTLTTTPILLIGASMVGVSCSIIGATLPVVFDWTDVWVDPPITWLSDPLALFSAAIVAALVGLLMTRFGVLGLRKLIGDAP
jgi:hypothetical protein